MRTIISSFEVERLVVPLKRPFITALGRKTETRNVGLTLRLKDGSVGYGEASSSLALAHLAPESLARTLERLGREAVGEDARRTRLLVERAWSRCGGLEPAASAFECALTCALLDSERTDLASWLGGSLKRLESDVTLSAWDAATTAAAAREAAREGFRSFKIKVGEDLERDLARVRAAAPRASSLILDGNQGMTVGSALRLVEAALKLGVPIDLLEQPLPKTDSAGMAALTRRSPVPVAADEMVMSPADAVRVADLRAANVINVKVAKSGLLRSLEIAAVARAAGMGLMLGCMMETARGLAPSVRLALGTGFFRYVDLDSDYLLAGQEGRGGFRRKGPFLSLG